MSTTHAPSVHPLPDGSIAVCCQDAWWCDDCGRFDHLAFDSPDVTIFDPLCWPCLRTRDEDHAINVGRADRFSHGR